MMKRERSYTLNRLLNHKRLQDRVPLKQIIQRKNLFFSVQNNQKVLNTMAQRHQYVNKKYISISNLVENVIQRINTTNYSSKFKVEKNNYQNFEIKNVSKSYQASPILKRYLKNVIDVNYNKTLESNLSLHKKKVENKNFFANLDYLKNKFYNLNNYKVQPKNVFNKTSLKYTTNRIVSKSEFLHPEKVLEKVITNKEIKNIVEKESKQMIRREVEKNTKDTLKIIEKRTDLIIKDVAPKIEENIMKRIKRTGFEDRVRRNF